MAFVWGPCDPVPERCRMRRDWVVGLVGLAAGGGIVAVMETSRHPDPPRDLGAHDRERARVESELKSLKQETAELRAELSAQAASPIPPATEDPFDHRRTSVVDEVERNHIDNEAWISELASKMGAEPRDPSWSRSAEQRLSGPLRSHASPGTELISIECRTTMCRLTLRQDDPRAQMALVHLIGAALPYAADIVYAQLTDRVATTWVYISREGRHLADR
jgi:hypothetical protein